MWNGHATDEVKLVIPISLFTAQYLENSWSYYLAVARIANYYIDSTVGHPSDSLASSCNLMSTPVHQRVLQSKRH